MKNESTSKNIVIISVNYYPEETAIGLYSTQMAEYLISKNWNVTVLTGFPYYPQWKIYKEYAKLKSFTEEYKSGIRIIRYKQYIPKKPTVVKRIHHIIDFTIGSFFNLKKIKNSDVILSVIPFISSAWLGKKLSQKLDAKHWIHIQDFELHAALESGIISDKIIGKLFSDTFLKFERNLLNNADITSTISHGMINKLNKISVTEAYLFPNWVDPNIIDPVKSKSHPYMESDNFKILYSGNIGAKQDWNFFIEITKRLKGNKKIAFIVVGNGSKKNELIQLTLNHKNIFHFESVAYNELNDLLCSANLHILFQKDTVIDAVMPSKILGMMASSKPSIITGNSKSEIAKVLKISNGGSFFNSPDIEAVTNSILKYYNDTKLADKIGKNARNFVISNFEKKIVLNDFNKKLESLINNNK